MSVSLNQGLNDLSKELGESVVNQSTNRISHYGDAVVQFFNDRKWSFGTKKNTSLTTSSGVKSYSLATITDMREPGPFKKIKIGTAVYIPISPEDAEDSKYSGKNYCYKDDEDNTLNFLSDIADGQTIEIRYWYIPARQTDINTGTYPVPDRYRKAVALLAAAFVQHSRYLEAQGNLKFNLYQRELKNIALQQSERNRNQPRTIKNFMSYRGFKRTYNK